MKTLLELSYQNYQGDDDILPEEIYWKVVDLSRNRIRKALQKQQTEFILKCIYLFQTTGVENTINETIGRFKNYQGSVWKIAVLHACCSFIFTPKEDRLIDIVDTMNNYLHVEEVEKREKIIEAMLQIDPNDLSDYIRVYLLFGKSLIPNI